MKLVKVMMPILLLVCINVDANPNPDSNLNPNSNVSTHPANSALESTLSAQSMLLQNKKWIHGALDCSKNTDPALDVFMLDKATYILRQNKCHTYEAPFIFVMMGTDTALVLDTGAIDDAQISPVYNKVRELVDGLDSQPEQTRKILVVHSHSHNDHKAGDVQFLDKPLTDVVPPEKAHMIEKLGFKNWPNELAELDLGNRKLTFIPTPGHHEDAISIYDEQTKWLLTGDSFYPGKIYVRDWEPYLKSVARLAQFAEINPVSQILGTHIEMTTKPGKMYPIGSVYQPDETALALYPEDLLALNQALQESADKRELVFDKIIITPMSVLQKTISNVLSWFL